MSEFSGLCDNGQNRLVVGLHVLNYGKEEPGSDRIPVEYVRAVCETFGISLEWLVRGEGPMLSAAKAAVDSTAEGHLETTQWELDQADS